MSHNAIVYRFMKRDDKYNVIENVLTSKMKIKSPQRKNLTLGNINKLLSYYDENNEELEIDKFTLGQIRGQGEIFERLLNAEPVRSNSEMFAFYAMMYSMYLNPKLLQNIYVKLMKELLEKQMFDKFGDDFKESLTILFPENKEKKDAKVKEIEETIVPTVK